MADNVEAGKNGRLESRAEVGVFHGGDVCRTKAQSCNDGRSKYQLR